MTTKIRIKDNGYGDKDVVTFPTEVPDHVGAYALQLIDKHANVAAHEDGEDSQGRSKFRLQRVEELVTRSFDIAERAFAVARERGHMIALPDLNEINVQYDAERAAERASTAEAKAAKVAKRAMENA